MTCSLCAILSQEERRGREVSHVKWYSTLVRKIWRLRKGSVSTVHTYGTRYSTLVLTIWFVSACEYAGNGSRYKV